MHPEVKKILDNQKKIFSEDEEHKKILEKIKALPEAGLSPSVSNPT